MMQYPSRLRRSKNNRNQRAPRPAAAAYDEDDLETFQFLRDNEPLTADDVGGRHTVDRMQVVLMPYVRLFEEPFLVRQSAWTPDPKDENSVVAMGTALSREDGTPVPYRIKITREEFNWIYFGNPEGRRRNSAAADDDDSLLQSQQPPHPNIHATPAVVTLDRLEDLARLGSTTPPHASDEEKKRHSRRSSSEDEEEEEEDEEDAEVDEDGNKLQPDPSQPPSILVSLGLASAAAVIGAALGQLSRSAASSSKH